MSERILDSSLLKAGDVVTVATKTRKGFWWKRFAVVMHVPDPTIAWLSHNDVELVNLELDMSLTEHREYDLETAVIHLVPNEDWPEGVSAMYAKALAKGWIKLA